MSRWENRARFYRRTAKDILEVFPVLLITSLGVASAVAVIELMQGEPLPYRELGLLVLGFFLLGIPLYSAVIAAVNVSEVTDR